MLKHIDSALHVVLIVSPFLLYAMGYIHTAFWAALALAAYLQMGVFLYKRAADTLDGALDDLGGILKGRSSK